MATGDYTVKATFNEPKYMNINDHPHPYGIFIAGNDMGTADQSYLYCAAYGNGNFIVRGFGPAAFQMNGRRGEAGASVNKAAGKDQPVTQEIAMSVKGDKRRVRDQRHRRRQLQQGRPRRRGQAQVDRRRVRHPLRPQHRSDRYWPQLDEELRQSRQLSAVGSARSFALMADG